MLLAADYPESSLPEKWQEALILLEKTETRYWNRLVIPIYANLKKNGLLNRLSEEKRVILQERFMDLLSVQMRQQFWLNRLVDSLIKKRISVILLKGAASIGTLYDPDYARVSQDIDLLINKKDRDVFDRETSIIVGKHHDKKCALLMSKLRHERNFPINIGLQFNLEPHTLLHPKYLFSINYKEIWETSLEHPLYNSKYIRILSPEHTLVYAATHAFFHKEYEPHHLVDVCRLLKTSDLDFEWVYRISKNWSCLKILTLMVNQISKWFSIECPSYPVHSEILNKLNLDQLIRDPSNPAGKDPGKLDYMKLMMLHDNLFRVAGFGIYYCFRKNLEYLLRICHRQ